MGDTQIELSLLEAYKTDLADEYYIFKCHRLYLIDGDRYISSPRALLHSLFQDKVLEYGNASLGR